jgi:hypothetical protein
MRTVLILLVAFIPLVAADKPAASKQEADKPAASATAKSAPKPVQIPAGAVETQPGTFNYTDPEGKKWIFRKTPFGVARMEDKSDKAPAAKIPAPPADNVKAVENGDSVHFERPGPFGMYKWDRKKSELSEAERGWLERSRTAATANNKSN